MRTCRLSTDCPPIGPGKSCGNYLAYTMMLPMRVIHQKQMLRRSAGSTMLDSILRQHHILPFSHRSILRYLSCPSIRLRVLQIIHFTKSYKLNQSRHQTISPQGHPHPIPHLAYPYQYYHIPHSSREILFVLHAVARYQCHLQYLSKAKLHLNRNRNPPNVESHHSTVTTIPRPNV